MDVATGTLDRVDGRTVGKSLVRQGMKELEVRQECLGSALVLHAVGPVDGNTASHLQEPLLRAAESLSGTVQLDLAEVPYMSSAGLRVLLLAAKACKNVVNACDSYMSRHTSIRS
jgi:anti-anti-sigma factor